MMASESHMGFGFQPGGGTNPGAVDDVEGAVDGGGSGGVGTLLSSEPAEFAGR